MVLIEKSPDGVFDSLEGPEEIFDVRQPSISSPPKLSIHNEIEVSPNLHMKDLAALLPWFHWARPFPSSSHPVTKGPLGHQHHLCTGTLVPASRVSCPAACSDYMGLPTSFKRENTHDNCEKKEIKNNQSKRTQRQKLSFFFTQQKKKTTSS